MSTAMSAGEALADANARQAVVARIIAGIDFTEALDAAVCTADRAQIGLETVYAHRGKMAARVAMMAAVENPGLLGSEAPDYFLGLEASDEDRKMAAEAEALIGEARHTRIRASRLPWKRGPVLLALREIPTYYKWMNDEIWPIRSVTKPLGAAFSEGYMQEADELGLEIDSPAAGRQIARAAPRKVKGVLFWPKKEDDENPQDEAAGCAKEKSSQPALPVSILTAQGAVLELTNGVLASTGTSLIQKSRILGAAAPTEVYFEQLRIRNAQRIASVALPEFLRS
jgi:hypothetical protein